MAKRFGAPAAKTPVPTAGGRASPQRGRADDLLGRLLLVRDLDEHVVDEPELLGLRRGEVAVPLGLGLNDLERLASVLGEDLVEPLLLLQDLAHLDLDV